MPSPLSPALSHRRIAPLPLRPRSNSGQPGSRDGKVANRSLSLKSSEGLSPSIWNSACDPDTSQSLNSATDGCHLSPPAKDIPGTVFRFGRSDSRAQIRESCETFTFRLLHNVTPRSSPQPEEKCLSLLEINTASVSSSSLPILATPEEHSLQPLSTLYSDKKITTNCVYVLPESPSHSYIGLSSGLAEDRGIESISRPLPTLSFHPPPDPGLNSSIRPRNVSGASIASETSNALPYDVRDEKAPLESFFSPEFQTALQNGINIAKSAATAITKLKSPSGLTDDLNRLLNDAKSLSIFQSSDTRTIAILGDSGDGKSSLINSLLHYPEIAKTGDIGTACTSVVTEYRQKTADHLAPITIEVEYLSQPEIEELIKALVWNYRRLYLPDMEGDDVDSNDYKQYQRESEQAWSALEAAFRHQKLFTQEFLSDMSAGALEKVTDQLIRWTQDLDWPEGGINGIWKSAANDAEECCEKTSTFMNDRFWPFTKIIRVYLNAQVLKTGVVLADLPGLQDTNLARVRATQTYLLKCDHVFIVAKISRAITDQSLKSSLYTVLSRHAPLEWEESPGKGLNLTVICTKAEDINLTTARREFCGPGKRIAMSLMEQLDKEIDDAKKAGDRGLKKELKRKQEYLLIEARSNHVKEGLQNAYASKVPQGKLEVFCVSNTIYQRFSRKGNAKMVHASGIPDLRRFCHSITANAQMQEANHFLHSTLSSLLNSIELWAHNPPVRLHVRNSGSDESIYDFLQGVRTEVSKIIIQSRESFKDTFGELLLDFLEKRGHFWERAAEAKGLEWRSWHWTQYKAWCQNYGDHKTTLISRTNWNAELIWKMRTELAYQWDLLEDEIGIMFDQLSRSVKLELLKLKEFILGQGFGVPLAEGIEFRIQDIEYKFGLVKQTFGREVKLIRRNASEPNAGSYILTEMIPSYRSASQERGTGMSYRQFCTVQGRITNGTLFPNISVAISKDMNEMSGKTFHGLQVKVDASLDLIKSDLHMTLSSAPHNDGVCGDQNDEGDERLRKDLAIEVEGLKAAQKELLGSIDAFLAKH